MALFKGEVKANYQSFMLSAKHMCMHTHIKMCETLCNLWNPLLIYFSYNSVPLKKSKYDPANIISPYKTQGGKICSNVNS